MLANSPPLPLIIDHFDEDHDITADDEEGIILALQHRDRVRRIRLMNPIPMLQKLINALEGEFPILEYLCVRHRRFVRPIVDHNMTLGPPETFRAPHLRHLLLMSFSLPIVSPVLTTMANLVTLSLTLIPSSIYFHPDALLQRLLHMPQLETLGVGFNSYYPSSDVERQLLQTPITTHVRLPNLRWFAFRGASAYLEALLPHVTIPLLERIEVHFFDQLTYPIIQLQQFMSTAGNLRLKTATLTFFKDYLYVKAYPYEGASTYTLSMSLGRKQLDWQVISASQVFHTLRTVLSVVEHLTLEYGNEGLSVSPEWNNGADRTQWRELLGSFGNVKTLQVCTDNRLVEQLSRVLQPGEGESPTELLPELQELSYPAIGASHNVFTLFIDARQKAGRPVTVVRS
jgi:hypothetical protein